MADPLSERKRKELATRALLGPRLPRSPRADLPPVLPPSTGGRRRGIGHSYRGHPTRDSGA